MSGLESVDEDYLVCVSYSSRTRAHQVKLEGQTLLISGNPGDDPFTFLALVVFRSLVSY